MGAPLANTGAKDSALRVFSQNLSDAQKTQAQTNIGGPFTSTALNDAALALKAPIASPTFTGTVTAPVLVGSVQALTTAALAYVIDVVSLATKLNVTDVGTATLADGVNGQLKIITFASGAGSLTITPATKTGFTNIALTALYQSATLQFYTTQGWMIVGGFTPPA